MKSLKDISWQCTEEEYRSDKAYSYSTLARFEREGFNNLDKLFDKVESPSLTFGSVVDCLMTDSQEEFDRRFLVADFPELPDSQRKVVEYLHRMFSKSYPALSDFDNRTIMDISETLQFQLNWKPETRARVIKENGGEYYDLLTLAEGRTVISQSLYSDALACVETLRTSEATKFFFEQDNPFDKDIERLYQLKFKGEYDGIPLRCMMDECCVDHKNKIIYPCDLKTSSKKEWDFPKSFIEWRYDIQGTLYAEVLKQNLAKDEYFKDFRIAPYRFIVVNRYSLIPLVWTFDQTFSQVGCALGEHKLRGWREIVKDLDYYLRKQPKVPIGIVEGTNSIEQYFNDREKKSN